MFSHILLFCTNLFLPQEWPSSGRIASRIQQIKNCCTKMYDSPTHAVFINVYLLVYCISKQNLVLFANGRTFIPIFEQIGQKVLTLKCCVFSHTHTHTYTHIHTLTHTYTHLHTHTVTRADDGGERVRIVSRTSKTVDTIRKGNKCCNRRK